MPGASGRRSLGALRSAAARSSARFTSAALLAPPPDGARAALKATTTSQSKTRRVSPRAGSRDTLTNLTEF